MVSSRLVLSSLCSLLLAGIANAAEITGGWTVGQLPATSEHAAGLFVSTYTVTDNDHWTLSGFYTEGGTVKNYQGGCIPRSTPSQQPSCFAMWADQTGFWSFPLGHHPLPSSAMKGRTATYSSGVYSPQQGPPGVQGPPGPRGLPGRDGRDGVDGVDGQDGRDGVDGSDGRDGTDGKDGEDAEEPEVTPPPTIDPPPPTPTSCAAPTNALWDYSDDTWNWCSQSNAWRAHFESNQCSIYRLGSQNCATFDFGGFGGTLRIEERTSFSRNDRSCGLVSSNAQDVCLSGSTHIVSTGSYLGQFTWAREYSVDHCPAYEVTRIDQQNGSVEFRLASDVAGTSYRWTFSETGFSFEGKSVILSNHRDYTTYDYTIECK